MKNITTFPVSFALLLTFAAAGCSLIAPTHYVSEASVAYDPANSARMRILSDNANGRAAFWTGTTCQPSGWWEEDASRTEINPGYWQRWKNSSQSVVIGMPPSPRSGMRPEGLQRKNLIREYVVPAGQPVTVAMGEGGVNKGISFSCPGVALAFTFEPQAGGDYDVFMKQTGRRQCAAAVHQISVDGGDIAVPIGLAWRYKASP